MWYRLLADIVAFIHGCYVLTVFFGLLLILVGHGCGWKWVTNRWFRVIHLAMIVGVVIRSLIWDVCPLTQWEYDLRQLAGQENFEGSPVGWLCDYVLNLGFPIWVYPVLYSTFGLLVVSSLWVVPVRWRVEATHRAQTQTNPEADFTPPSLAPAEQ